MIQQVVLLCRWTTAAMMLVGAVSVLGATDAWGSEGGCLPRNDYVCITDDPETRPYEDKYCASGGGGRSCVTCTPEPEAVCNAFNKDALDVYNPS